MLLDKGLQKWAKCVSKDFKRKLCQTINKNQQKTE